MEANHEGHGWQTTLFTNLLVLTWGLEKACIFLTWG